MPPPETGLPHVLRATRPNGCPPGRHVPSNEAGWPVPSASSRPSGRAGGGIAAASTDGNLTKRKRPVVEGFSTGRSLGVPSHVPRPLRGRSPRLHQDRATDQSPTTRACRTATTESASPRPDLRNLRDEQPPCRAREAPWRLSGGDGRRGLRKRAAVHADSARARPRTRRRRRRQGSGFGAAGARRRRERIRRDALDERGSTQGFEPGRRDLERDGRDGRRLPGQPEPVRGKNGEKLRACRCARRRVVRGAAKPHDDPRERGCRGRSRLRESARRERASGEQEGGRPGEQAAGLRSSSQVPGLPQSANWKRPITASSVGRL